jgi:hypothetical protein
LSILLTSCGRRDGFESDEKCQSAFWDGKVFAR